MLSRRTFLTSVSVIALGGGLLAVATPIKWVNAVPVPLNNVRLKPSIYSDAVNANKRYLLSLEPGRLLHNFHASAGLPVEGAVYGGWEARGIAGHTLGHYLSACSLMFAQTGDEVLRQRVAMIVDELARCQAAHGDGYIGGTTVERDGEVVDGKVVFEEIRAGDIRTGGFDVNGGWVPLYTWHKVHAGLIDAYRHCDNARARDVMLGMADYLAAILEGLNAAQMQKLLAAEHGGLNKTYAETYAITGNPRWLRLAEKIRHRQVLDPLSAGRNILPGLHANTQIPKVIGLARLHELTGEAQHARTARLFHQLVVNHHSYVIGGNSEREHFGPPDTLSPFITDRACEACNTYNMLKLTRHLYSWRPDAAYFDFYERAHLNHIMAHQNPDTGMFAYFMPLTSGSKRVFSSPDDSFWCCVGSGMESHAKHGDSIYWHDEETLYVNLFIASRLEWTARGMVLDMDTDFPFSQSVTVTISATGGQDLALALRLPAWSQAPTLRVNGAFTPITRRNGYALLKRAWRAGDRIELTLPMSLKAEATPDDPRVTAFTHGPLVLAADLGPSNEDFDQPPPALIGEAGIDDIEAIDPAAHLFRAQAAAPRELTLRPFFNQHTRRTAVYFPLLTKAEWRAEESAFLAAERAKASLRARTVDVIHLGETQSERDHDFRTNHSDLIAYGGRIGRQAWWGEGNYIEFDLGVSPGAMILQALYWGEEIDKNFDILVDGVLLARERRDGAAEKAFQAVDYFLPASLTQGKEKVRIRFETRGSDAPVYECRILSAEAGKDV